MYVQRYRAVGYSALSSSTRHEFQRDKPVSGELFLRSRRAELTVPDHVSKKVRNGHGAGTGVQIKGKDLRTDT
jgi:hypothetical protein